MRRGCQAQRRRGRSGGLAVPAPAAIPATSSRTVSMPDRVGRQSSSRSARDVSSSGAASAMSSQPGPTGTARACHPTRDGRARLRHRHLDQPPAGHDVGQVLAPQHVGGGDVERAPHPTHDGLPERRGDVVGVHHLQPQTLRPRQRREVPVERPLRHPRPEEVPRDLVPRGALEHQRGPQPGDREVRGRRPRPRRAPARRKPCRRCTTTTARRRSPSPRPAGRRRARASTHRRWRRRPRAAPPPATGRVEDPAGPGDVDVVQPAAVVARLDRPRELDHRVGPGERGRQGVDRTRVGDVAPDPRRHVVGRRRGAAGRAPRDPHHRGHRAVVDEPPQQRRADVAAGTDHDDPHGPTLAPVAGARIPARCMLPVPGGDATTTRRGPRRPPG